MQPHSAIDVVADGLRDNESFGCEHGANRNSAGLMKIRRDRQLHDLGRPLQQNSRGPACFANSRAVELSSKEITYSSVTASDSIGTSAFAKIVPRIPSLSNCSRLSSIRLR